MKQRRNGISKGKRIEKFWWGSIEPKLEIKLHDEMSKKVRNEQFFSTNREFLVLENKTKNRNHHSYAEKSSHIQIYV